MGSLTGKMDPNATNTTLGGKVVGTGTPGGQVVADPNQGLSGGQLFARKAIASGLSGAGQALQQQGGSSLPLFNFNQPQPKKQPLQVGINGNSSPFPSGPNPNLYG